MGISGLVQSYDSRGASSAALSRTIMAPQFQYAPVHTYSGVSTRDMVATHQVQQQNHFSYNGYSGPNNVIVPAFANNFVQQRPRPRLMQVDDDVSRTVSYARTSPPGYVQEHHSQIPPIKTEPQWSVPPPIMRLSSNTSNMASISTQPQEVSFGTEVDFLMKAIQAKTQTQPQTTSSAEQNRPVDDSTSPKGGKKRYYCTIANCNKSFYQKTQLNIHERAHTGAKPYTCKEPGCSRSFSQLGNLKTHERRHTGERPYSCEICGKRFSQRSNVRAHKIVHDQSKPYKCRLDHCDKNFTQLGNLKSHQNKFHVPTIRRLTAKYTSAQDGDVFNAAEKELWEYFANLYKNSNKGIKGRGKDRKVGANSHSSPSNSGMNLNSDMRGLGLSGGRGFGVPGGGRGNIVVGVGAGVGMGGVSGMGRGDVNQGAYEQKYEMFDMDEESQVWV